MSGYTFTNAQAAIITGPELSQIVGPDVAGAISAAFSQATPDDQGSRTVELGAHRPAVLAALREISADCPDATRMQATEQLLKTLS